MTATASAAATAPGVDTTAAELRDITKHYSSGRALGRHRSPIRAVDGVSLVVPAGQTLGLVGESGSGKSTIARLLLRLVEPTSGQVFLHGDDITSTRGAELRRLRRRMQLVFQDPHASFDPLSSIGASVEEALRARGHARPERPARLRDVFDRVRLSEQLLGRRPAEVSGGQLQRASLARALAVEPSVLVLDEPVSSLDVSTQAQILNLLREIQHDLGLSCLFISHDLSVVRHVSDVVAVMYLGRIVELGPTATLWHQPRHPYTRALLSAVPLASPTRQRARERIVLQGEIPSPASPPSGCRFRTRCPSALPVCAELEPAATTTDDGVTVFCHLHASPTNGLSGGRRHVHAP